MYNPYEEMMRRRQQPQYPETPMIQQPAAPMSALPTYSGPELMPWMANDGQQAANEGAAAGGQGLGMLLKRFKPQGGSLGEHGPR